ncbi:MAG: phosphoribosylanthranilate isomerase [Pseudoxanthomonas sp.]
MSATRIKLCGMTRAQDVRLAVELGVDYVGLIFAGGPRRLSLEQGAELRALVPAEVAAVALLRDAERATVEAVIEVVAPDLLQFHGGEDDAFCASFGLPFLKAVAMAGVTDPAQVPALLAAWPSAAGFVLDSHAAGQGGGTGRTFDWSLWPADPGRPCLLAGGLTADNVAQAVRTARPWGVDVASGIEDAPGRKNADRMRAFVAAARM